MYFFKIVMALAKRKMEGGGGGGDALRVRLQLVVIAYEMVDFHFLHTAKGLATKSIKMTLVSVGSL